MNRRSLPYLGIIASLFVGACGSDPASGGSDTTGGDGVGGTSPTSDVSGNDAAAGSIAAELVGEWEIPCRPAGGAYSQYDHLSVTETGMVYTYTQHKGDPTCSDDSSLVIEMIIEDSAWSVGAAYGEGVALDKVLAKATIEIDEQGAKSYWDSNAGCGPFPLGEAKDVSGMRCYGAWYPQVGGTYYTIVSVRGDTMQLGAWTGGETAAARPDTLDPVRTWARVGAEPDGFIRGKINDDELIAEKNTAARAVTNGHIQLGATTKALAPWETWIINVPNEVGTHSCDNDAINAYINFGFTDENNLPVLWDTESDGGAGCSITVTKAAPAVGDTIEGTFEGTLGDALGNGHQASEGQFVIVRME